MCEAEHVRDCQHAHERGQNARRDRCEHGQRILFQKIKLAVERDGQAHRRRCEQVGDIFGTRVVAVIVDAC
ncbi:hypothetical protein SDC9_208451 [bioreactor metagenome]|uniref:Uncharacterized protein n=1 Tax=bioreactor metagenome TaxID=1076179 RepID=A0A645JCD5_9ZZZZ